MAMKVRYTTVNGKVIAEKRNGIRSFYVADSLGSTVALIDNTQTITDTFEYWPYGEARTRTGTNTTPLQFVGTRGYFTDSSSKTYVRARTLDTQKGRWMTKDPIGFEGGDWNLYRYVSNNPTSTIDPLGLKPSLWSWFCCNRWVKFCCGNSPTPLPICKCGCGNRGCNCGFNPPGKGDCTYSCFGGKIHITIQIINGIIVSFPQGCDYTNCTLVAAKPNINCAQTMSLWDPFDTAKNIFGGTSCGFTIIPSLP